MQDLIETSLTRQFFSARIKPSPVVNRIVFPWSFGLRQKLSVGACAVAAHLRTGTLFRDDRDDGE
jgi:hypothetical protein